MSLFGFMKGVGKEVSSWDKAPISKEESERQLGALEDRKRQVEDEFEVLMKSKAFGEKRSGGGDWPWGGREEKWESSGKPPWYQRETRDPLSDLKRLLPEFLEDDPSGKVGNAYISRVGRRLANQHVPKEHAVKKIREALRDLDDKGVISFQEE